jgi:hypothetical protein
MEEVIWIYVFKYDFNVDVKCWKRALELHSRTDGGERTVHRHKDRDERPGRRTAYMLAIFLIKWIRLNLDHKIYTAFCSPRAA